MNPSAWLELGPDVLWHRLTDRRGLRSQNVQCTTILGLVGAGGLGLVFFRQMNTFNYHGVMTVIIAILGLILLGEAFSHWVRRKII